MFFIWLGEDKCTIGVTYIMDDVTYDVTCLTVRRYANADYAVALFPSVRLSVCLKDTSKSVFYPNG